jgi:hypothetical protein
MYRHLALLAGFTRTTQRVVRAISQCSLTLPVVKVSRCSHQLRFKSFNSTPSVCPYKPVSRLQNSGTKRRGVTDTIQYMQ